MHKALYIHIPFCVRKCHYCNFCSIPFKNGIAVLYVRSLIRQIKSLDRDFSTIYIGGGTPTVLSTGLLKSLLKALKRFLYSGIEFSVEANPDSLDREKLKLFLNEGVNRISIGVQSFDDAKLRRLGRIHNGRQAYDKILLAADEGFKNISADLIYAVCGESLNSWKDDLRQAAGLPLAHLSCYSLAYEPATALYAKVKSAKIIPIDSEEAGAMYKLAMDYLPRMGLTQYEVSNFSRIGKRCRHNLHYWRNDPYIGLGPGAASYIDGVRTRNISTVAEYIRRVNKGRSLSTFRERLIPLRSAKETAALKVRTAEGIDYAWFNKKTGFDFAALEGPALKKLFSLGLIAAKIKKGKTIGVTATRKGFLFCDDISSGLI